MRENLLNECTSIHISQKERKHNFIEVDISWSDTHQMTFLDPTLIRGWNVTEIPTKGTYVLWRSLRIPLRGKIWSAVCCPWSLLCSGLSMLCNSMRHCNKVWQNQQINIGQQNEIMKIQKNSYNIITSNFRNQIKSKNLTYRCLLQRKMLLLSNPDGSLSNNAKEYCQGNLLRIWDQAPSIFLSFCFYHPLWLNKNATN